jgi:lysophospholipase L1-like esterase
MKLVCLRYTAALLLALAGNLAPAMAATPPNWVATWAAAPDSAGPALPPQTIRQVVRTSVGGDGVRIRLSNLHGAGPVGIGPVHVAVRAAGASIEPGSDRALTFNGSPTVAIAKGDSVLSDAVDMSVAPLRELAVSLYLPDGAGVASIHGAGMQTAYIVRGADATAALSFAVTETDDSRYFLTDVEVASDAKAWAVVVVGDSIADGVGSKEDANARWPDLLAARLTISSIAVVNAGIAGNRLLKAASKPFVGPSALARFERDALDKPGVRWIVLHEGLNDISAGDMLASPAEQVSARQIIDGMQTLIRQAHARGVRICGGTLTPYGGVGKPFVHSALGEAKRQEVNAWIREAGGFDAVVDFDRVLRDPQRPTHLLPAFDSGDHLHPNDSGYQAMAEAAAVALNLVEARRAD